MFEQVKQEIDDKIKTNGNNEITATRLNGVLQNMMDAAAEEIEDVAQSVGDQVEANPAGDVMQILTKIKIGNTIYTAPQGPAGPNGITPHIGDNGDWYIGDQDTGVQAEGQDGTNGTNGITPTINPSNKHWMIGETDTGIVAEGQDGTNGTNGTNGVTPTINPSNKHWMIGDQDTGVQAEGQDGTNGTNGTNGVTPTINPSNKHWMIGETDTGIVAEGQDGQNGAPGQNAVNPFKGYWESLSALKAAHTAVNGDYAYVADQSPATTVSLYAYDPAAATDNYWSDTGIDMSITDMESIFSFSAKTALLELLEKVAYIDPNGAQYIENLRNLLYGEVSIVSISAAYDQGDDVVLTSDSLAKLRNYLTVTATYSNGNTGVVNNYELSGTLSAGANTITVTYGEVSTTFSVTAVDVTGYTIYDYVAAKQVYAIGSIARNIRLKQYANLNVLSCKFKCKPIANHVDGSTIFGARTTGATTHTNSYAFYMHTGALGYHLHGMEAVEGMRPQMNEGQINIVEYINTTASPSEVVTNDTNHQQITWDNNSVLNLKPSLFYNTIDETNGPVQAAVEMGWLIFLDLNGDKVGHYLPAVRNSDSVIGMLDIIEGTFYTAATTNYAKIGNSNCMYKVGNW